MNQDRTAALTAQRLSKQNKRVLKNNLLTFVHLLVIQAAKHRIYCMTPTDLALPPDYDNLKHRSSLPNIQIPQNS